MTLIPNGRSNPAPTDSRYLQILHHTIMFLVWTLNIILYRYDSSLFNYHATIINQLFNYHFGRFTRNRHTPKALKTECFAESISLFFRNTLLFCKKDVRSFPQNTHIRAIYTSIWAVLRPGSAGVGHPGLDKKI